MQALVEWTVCYLTPCIELKHARALPTPNTYVVYAGAGGEGPSAIGRQEQAPRRANALSRRPTEGVSVRVLVVLAYAQ
jgi:hypothetical protein